MQRGALIIYDNSGVVFFNSGEAEGDVGEHIYPDGLPYLELPYGILSNKVVVSVDVESKTVNLENEPLSLEGKRIKELEDELLLTSGVI